VPTANDRLATIRAYVDSRPDEPFPRYGLAMEYAKLGFLAEAEAEFQTLRSQHPDYVATYYQLGMVLTRLERVPEARSAWEEGIRQSLAKGDTHTAGELEAALAAFPGGGSL
jgi:tetratricopeptide (TPR) repeat protein